MPEGFWDVFLVILLFSAQHSLGGWWILQSTVMLAKRYINRLAFTDERHRVKANRVLTLTASRRGNSSPMVL